MTLFIGLCMIAFLAVVASGDHTIVCVCVHVCVSVCNARSSGLGAGGNSFGTPQEHPGPVFGSLSELCSPLLVLVETGNWGWIGRERKVTIWQEDQLDLDFLRKRTGTNATRMSKQLLCVS